MKSFRVFLFAFSILSLMPILGHAQDRSDPYYNAGNTLYGQKSYDQAIRYYQAALQLNPNKWEADQGMGNCYYAKGDKPTALTYYQKALDLNPGNTGLANFVQALRAQVPAAPAGGLNPVSSQPSVPVGQSAAPAVDRNLPKEGKIAIEIAEWDWMGSWTDMQNITGGGTYSSTPIGIGLEAGAAYVFAPNIQAGAKLQYMLKQPEEITYGTAQTYDFTENLIGGALEGEGVFPISDGINFIGGLQLGFYTMLGSTIVGSGFFNYTADLSGSGPGGKITLGVELLMDSSKSWALDIGFAYQALSISPITETVSGSSGSGGSGGNNSVTLKNADGSNASFDFSGPGLFLGVRFF